MRSTGLNGQKSQKRIRAEKRQAENLEAYRHRVVNNPPIPDRDKYRDLTPSEKKELATQFIHGFRRNRKNPNGTRVAGWRKQKAIDKRIKRYQKSANERGLHWQLSDGEAAGLFTRKCHWCHAGCESNSDSRDRKMNGIDRINNELGYIYSNCVSCCAMCNKMKNAYTVREFLDKIHRIAAIHTPLPK